MVLQLHNAIRDFRETRQKAALREMIARLRGTQSPQLLQYEQVRSMLKGQVAARQTLQEIPLDAIVGSVNRYEDFTRDFLPRESVSEERWARVEVATYQMKGLPPIDVYQIDQAYFVSDGNHRVSVARRLGATHIHAYVTPVQTRVPLTPDTLPEDLILKAEYAAFLEHTDLDKARPKIDLSVSVPGQHQLLEEHIAVHRYYMGAEQRREVSLKDAAVHWFDTVYWPIVQTVRERGLLHDFPGRTETDLYLWVVEHQSRLQEELSGWVEPAEAASDLSAQFSRRPEHVAARLGQKVLHAIIPKTFEDGPEAGLWRQEKAHSRQPDRLFNDILVPVNGKEDGWNALEQAILVAHSEGARLHGLHVLPSKIQQSLPKTAAVQERFEQRCREAGVTGRLVVTTGHSISNKICESARWNDLVIVNLTYPPKARPIARLSSGFRSLVQRCPRPILAVPQRVQPIQRCLLAYDGSPKAREAMFVAAYLAGQWKLPLFVVTILDTDLPEETLMEAMVYMEEHGIQANPVVEKGPVAEAILKAAEEHHCDLLLMGGYGNSPVVGTVLGTVVDHVLRQSHRPILLCR